MDKGNFEKNRKEMITLLNGLDLKKVNVEAFNNLSSTIIENLKRVGTGGKLEWRQSYEKTPIHNKSYADETPGPHDKSWSESHKVTDVKKKIG